MSTLFRCVYNYILKVSTKGNNTNEINLLQLTSHIFPSFFFSQLKLNELPKYAFLEKGLEKDSLNVSLTQVNKRKGLFPRKHLGKHCFVRFFPSFWRSLFCFEFGFVDWHKSSFIHSSPFHFSEINFFSEVKDLQEVWYASSFLFKFFQLGEETEQEKFLSVIFLWKSSRC